MILKKEMIFFPLAAVVCTIGVFIGGYVKGKHSADLALAQVKQEHAEAVAKANAEYAAQLQAAQAEQQKWRDFAQAQSVKLADAVNKLDKKEFELKKEIQNAVEQDNKSSGNCVGGLGARSLQLYERALGY